MVCRATLRRVQEAVSHRGHPPNLLIELGGASTQQRAIDTKLAADRQHSADLI